MPDLPQVSDRRLAVRVTSDALRQIRGGHPWVFDGSIRSVSHDGAPGDLAVVFDERRRFAAIGLWDPTSPIRVRILHVGQPTPIDQGFWSTAILGANERRRPLIDDPDTDALRIVHGENDGLPGLIIDRYRDTMVLKLYSAAWLPHLGALVTAAVGDLGAERVVLRTARALGRSDLDGRIVHGPDVDGPVPFTENGLVFGADVCHGHKTGHFLDQRDNRQLVAAHAPGAEVLDVFCATGGFSVHAAAGGAESVTMVDQSRPAIREAHRNLDRNRDRAAVAHCVVSAHASDAFAVLDQLGRHQRRFDVVVVDPPAFASRSDAVAGALGAYRRLAAAALTVCRPGGRVLLASCSSRVGLADLEAQVVAGAASARADIEIERRCGQPLDHPVGFPQGAYLDALFFRRTT